MLKKTFVPAAAEKTFTVYGSTDNVDATVTALNGKTVIRSDYLDKIAEYVKTGKFAVTFIKFPFSKVESARGYDGDHPFVTKEKGKFRAWRYVAVLN